MPEVRLVGRLTRAMAGLSENHLAFITAQRVGRLATAGAAGIPHVVPVCFAYSDGCFWIAIDEKPKRTGRLKRLKNIEQNPNVALVFDRYDEDWTRLAYVMVWGTALIVEDGIGYSEALMALRQRYPQYRAMDLEGRPAIRVAPSRVVSWGELA